SEFLSPLCNTRTDEYGGNPENRVRILGEILDAVRSVWKDKPIEVRVSAEDYAEGGNTAHDLADMLNMVKSKGIDSVNVSSGGVVNVMPKVFPNYQVPFAKIIRDVTALPVVAGGLIESAREAERIIADGEADQVYWGRELLRNPYFPLHAMKETAPEQMASAVPTQYKRAF
ncbi:MAG: tRNA-dihydrouridine synthase, partial [Bacillota bacterium]|nr:tRNA-dihydrouridine synthase [Bacillota bacterium]